MRPRRRAAEGYWPSPINAPWLKIQLPANWPLIASSTTATATLIVISASVIAFIREPKPVVVRSAARVTFRIPCGFPEWSGQRSPTGAGVMHS